MNRFGAPGAVPAHGKWHSLPPPAPSAVSVLRIQQEGHLTGKPASSPPTRTRTRSRASRLRELEQPPPRVPSGEQRCPAGTSPPGAGGGWWLRGQETPDHSPDLTPHGRARDSSPVPTTGLVTLLARHSQAVSSAPKTPHPVEMPRRHGRRDPLPRQLIPLLLQSYFFLV